MPNPSIWMIRLSLIYLLGSVLIGGLILSHKAIDIHPVIWSLLPLHYELAIWGWLVQLVIGTAYWMFPKKLEGARRGPELPAKIMVILFNAGLVLLVSSSFLIDHSMGPIVGRSLILMSIVTFIFLMWSRIVSYKKN